MSGGGGGVTGGITTNPLSPATWAYAGSKLAVQKGLVRGKFGEKFAELDPTALPPEAPEPDAAPTMEDVAAKEPNKEKRRRQRMAALMMQGRQGTILSGPGGATTPNNSIGGGGKQVVGA